MSAGAALSARDETLPRHRLLTFAALWRRTETMLLYGAAVLLIGTLVTYLDNHKLEIDFLILGGLLLLLGAGFHLGSRRHYVQATAEGLRLNALLKFELIPFQEIRQAVSYTHLDVYKRQIYYWAISLRMPADKVKGYTSTVTYDPQTPGSGPPPVHPHVTEPGFGA